jgi:transcriptional regulator with XRE-family HTH domain
MSLGQIIRAKREKLNLTLDEVGARIGFSKPYLSTIETGKVNNPPSDGLLKKLEKVLKFEPGLLLHIAHMERIPPDVRQEFESAEAENERLRQFIKNLARKKTKSVQLDQLLGDSELSDDKVTASLSAGRLVPVINKVAAGYPSDFDDLDYPLVTLWSPGLEKVISSFFHLLPRSTTVTIASCASRARTKRLSKGCSSSRITKCGFSPETRSIRP